MVEPPGRHKAITRTNAPGGLEGSLPTPVPEYEAVERGHKPMSVVITGRARAA
jgi:hypothetical protein